MFLAPRAISAGVDALRPLRGRDFGFTLVDNKLYVVEGQGVGADTAIASH